MANNFVARDGNGASQTFKSTDTAGVHTPHHNVDAVPADPFGLNADAMVAGGATGSLSAKMRRLTNDLATLLLQTDTLEALLADKPILASGVTELIGINEAVDQNKYSDEVAVALGGSYSGEILNVVLFSTEDGSGTVLRPNGTLFLLSADPAIALNAATLGAGAVWPTVLGQIEVAVSDWSTTDTGGASATKPAAIAFPALSTIYAVWFHKLATGFNDAAGDDEQLEFQFWFQ